MSDSTTYGAVLCAGFGSRLRPLTEAIPKPLLPFLNTPIVTYALSHLAQAGVGRVVLNLHHLADAIPPVVDRLATSFGLSPVYAREWEILGTAGGIRGMWQALGEPEGTLVVLNGDSVMDLDLTEHLARHRASGDDVTLVVRPKADDQPGRVWLDGERLAGIREYRHPQVGARLVEHDFTGVHIVETSVLADLPSGFGDIVDELYGPLLQRGGAIGVSLHEGFWAALDNPRLFLETTARVLADPSAFAQSPLPEPLSQGLYVFRQQGISDRAQFRAPVFTGMHVEIGAGAHVGPHVVLDGVEVAPNAVVENAVLYGMGRIEGEWRDCIAVAGRVAQL